MQGINNSNGKLGDRWAFVKLIARYMFCYLLISATFAGLAKGREGDGESANSVKSLAKEQALSEEMKKLEVFDFREKGLLDKLAKLEMEIEAKKKEIRDMENRISALEEKYMALTKTFLDLQAKEMQLEERLAKRLVYLYKYARRGYMRALCTARDLDEFRRRAKYLAVVMAEDHSLLKKIFIQRDEVNKKLQKVKDEKVRTDALMNKEKRSLALLKSGVERNVIQLMRIHEEKEFYKTALRELEQVNPKFNETIVKVEDREDNGPLDIGNVSALRGKLLVPLIGTVVRGEKLFRSKSIHLDKGIFIRGSEGEEVKAILPGRVEFSGRLKGYGQVIIINHGSRFFTISALLSRREKQEGDLVKKGEVIGEVGSVKNGIGPSLYFEIRKGGKNLDPLKWLKIKG